MKRQKQDRHLDFDETLDDFGFSIYWAPIFFLAALGYLLPATIELLIYGIKALKKRYFS